MKAAYTFIMCNDDRDDLTVFGGAIHIHILQVTSHFIHDKRNFTDAIEERGDAPFHPLSCSPCTT